MISRKERHGGFTFITVTDTGINHRIHNIPNQDSVTFSIIDNDFALAVSDGVGSCVNAELGSKSAVNSVETVFLSIKRSTALPDPTEIVGRIIDEWMKLLDGRNLNDCCATLKAVMKFGNRLLLFSIGDGLLAVTSGGIWCCTPLENDLFTNQTKCLNTNIEETDFWISEYKLDTYMPYVVFACTDGVSNGIQEGCEREFVSEIETISTGEELQNELEALLADLAEYSSDDRTVGVVKYERENAKPDR